MTTSKASSTVTINAPIEKVFGYVFSPAMFEDNYPELAVENWNQTPEGVGSSFQWKSTVFFVHMKGHMECLEFAENEKIVMKSSTGPVWTFTFAPADGGAEFTVAMEETTKIPLLDKAMVFIGTEGKGLQHEMDKAAAFVKKHFDG